MIFKLFKIFNFCSVIWYFIILCIWNMILKLFWVSILKYCTHKMRAFSKALISRNSGLGAHVEQTGPSHPDAHSSFVRQEEWLESFCFIYILICFLTSCFFGILSSVRLTGSSLSCSQYDVVFSFYFSPCSSKFSLFLMVIMHFCELYLCKCSCFPKKWPSLFLNFKGYYV